MELRFGSSSPADTREIAGALGSVLRPGDVVALLGDLGAGKTEFCKGIGEALGIPAARIVSPSFTIVSEHRGRALLRHVDAYRLAGGREAADIGLDEMFGGDGICVIEWADRIESVLPKDCIKVRFTILKGDRRTIVLSGAEGSRLADLLSRCERLLSGGEE